MARELQDVTLVTSWVSAMPGTSTDAVTEVAAALRRYLRAHPQACDTSEGIAAWWRPLPRVAGNAPDVVAQALAALVASGEMECALGPDGQAVYRAARPAARKGMQVEPPGS